MNFKSIGLGVAAVAATLAAGAPADALSLAGNNVSLTARIDIERISEDVFSLRFSNARTIVSTSNFPPFVDDDAFTIANLLNVTANTDLGAFDNLFSGIATSAGDVNFDATSIFFRATGVPGNGRGFYDLEIEGFFEGPGVGQFTPGSGTLTSQLETALKIGSARATGVSGEFTAVPSPALVPAALGFGAAMLRKRKGEQSPEDAEKETAGVKA